MFSVIVAADKNNGIGKNNTLPWALKADMKYFKEVTSKATFSTERNVVIMGKNTWFSIPEKFRPLPNRLNVVISKQMTFSPSSSELTNEENLWFSSTFETALKSINIRNSLFDKIFVIGGGQLYKEAFIHPDCSEILLTRIDADYNCDVFVPEIPNDFCLVSSTPQEENSIKFSFETYRKINCCM
jgi:dihydrofolate reductase